jgi:hypothetical protein
VQWVVFLIIAFYACVRVLYYQIPIVYFKKVRLMKQSDYDIRLLLGTLIFLGCIFEFIYGQDASPKNDYIIAQESPVDISIREYLAPLLAARAIEDIAYVIFRIDKMDTLRVTKSIIIDLASPMLPADKAMLIIALAYKYDADVQMRTQILNLLTLLEQRVNVSLPILYYAVHIGHASMIPELITWYCSLKMQERDNCVTELVVLSLKEAVEHNSTDDFSSIVQHVSINHKIYRRMVNYLRRSSEHKLYKNILEKKLQIAT